MRTLKSIQQSPGYSGPLVGPTTLRRRSKAVIGSSETVNSARSRSRQESKGRIHPAWSRSTAQPTQRRPQPSCGRARDPTSASATTTSLDPLRVTQGHRSELSRLRSGRERLRTPMNQHEQRGVICRLSYDDRAIAPFIGVRIRSLSFAGVAYTGCLHSPRDANNPWPKPSDQGLWFIGIWRGVCPDQGHP